jgi:hypothetical protein
MQAVEEAIQKATQDGTIPGAVMLAETRDGRWSSSASSVHPDI